MEPQSQISSYRHLLDIAEGIITTSQDKTIVDKYYRLKQAILNKTEREQSQLPFYKKVTAVYKTLMQGTIRIISQFEKQLEEEMERKQYNSEVIKFNKEMAQEIQLVKELASKGEGRSKLIQKEEWSTLTYLFQQFDSKFENLGLMIEVHKKMHEIIVQAGANETERAERQQRYKQKIRLLQKQFEGISEAKKVLSQRRLLQQQFATMHYCSTKLAQILFSVK